MIIDCHVHLITATGYIDRLVAEMDKLGIAKVCLLAGQNNIKFWGARMASNEQLIDAYKVYPDRIIPFGFVELGADPPTLIETLYAKGCRGLKVTRPRYNYNDDRLLEYYRRACAYNMPILFHTGTVLRTDADQYYDVDSSRMKPIFLDRIARKFPDLTLIGAHLGNPWYEEAAMTLFWNTNLYFDLSGTILKRKDAAWFTEVLWWSQERLGKLDQAENSHYKRAVSHPFDRICFGSDVPIEEMEQVMEEYHQLFEALNFPPPIRQKVMGQNLADILNLQPT
ncbi:amidohydrolase family protein [candidate division KSB3 bacterium]|uniref:Amidohydrolase family protein n=1 Tax=candidate division KSB3 bacterium TaxID=2044937 RepID=A0A9D5K0T5_9BACT|nr:amidohydrolase family protein [candidate division KSB3 bacterium]MBD3327262.1 amidohydrolase family protein [candidate division KSB3 bacterium]